MNRRSFLQHLGLVAAAAATPKFIFDMGKNLRRSESGFLYVKAPKELVQSDFSEDLPTFTIETLKWFYETMSKDPSRVEPINGYYTFNR